MTSDCLLTASLVACCLAASASAQDPPFRASLRSQFDTTVTYADVWGEGDFAYMSRSGSNGVEFLDISDPDDAQYVLTYTVPSPNNAISSQDHKVDNGLLYILLAGSGPDSVQIVDVRDPASPAFLTNVSVAGLTVPHNIFVQNGWLYMCDGSNPTIGIVDLRTYDPDNPPAQISAATYVLNVGGSVHDITANGDLLWVSDIAGRLVVYDIGDLASGAPVFLGSIRAGSMHSSWPTPDNQLVATAEEVVGGPIRLFEAIDGGGSIDLVQRDSWVNPLVGVGASGNPHNPLIDGNRVYVANNSGGVACLQIDRHGFGLELVASFDTSTVVPTAASGQGCWGVYPFLGADRILASDRQTGFFVLDLSALEITFDAARPTTVPAGKLAALDVTIEELGSATLDPGTVELRTGLNGGPFVAQAMASTGAGGWRQASRCSTAATDSTATWLPTAWRAPSSRGPAWRRARSTPCSAWPPWRRSSRTTSRPTRAGPPPPARPSRAGRSSAGCRSTTGSSPRSTTPTAPGRGAT